MSRWHPKWSSRPLTNLLRLGACVGRLSRTLFFFCDFVQDVVGNGNLPPVAQGGPLMEDGAPPGQPDHVLQTVQMEPLAHVAMHAGVHPGTDASIADSCAGTSVRELGAPVAVPSDAVSQPGVEALAGAVVVSLLAQNVAGVQ
jgi:hypothetical protein